MSARLLLDIHIVAADLLTNNCGDAKARGGKSERRQKGESIRLLICCK